MASEAVPSITKMLPLFNPRDPLPKRENVLAITETVVKILSDDKYSGSVLYYKGVTDDTGSAFKMVSRDGICDYLSRGNNFETDLKLHDYYSDINVREQLFYFALTDEWDDVTFYMLLHTVENDLLPLNSKTFNFLIFTSHIMSQRFLNHYKENVCEKIKYHITYYLTYSGEIYRSDFNNVQSVIIHYNDNVN